MYLINAETSAGEPFALNYAIFWIDTCNDCPWPYRVGLLLTPEPREDGQSEAKGDYLRVPPTLGGSFVEAGRLLGVEFESEGACSLDPPYLEIEDPGPPLDVNGQPLLVGSIICEGAEWTLSGTFSAGWCSNFAWPAPACE